MAITEFQGEHRWLSNFWPVKVIYDGDVYPSVEHAYQGAKTYSAAARARIRACISPAIAKQMGKAVTLRSDWDKDKGPVMLRLLRQKFSLSEPGLRQRLIDTGDQELIEGNRWSDTFWGVCKGVGENNLGKLLMQVREEIKN